MSRIKSDGRGSSAGALGAAAISVFGIVIQVPITLRGKQALNKPERFIQHELQ
jgi:hypothetical protein